LIKREIFAFSLSSKDEAFSPNDMEKTVNWLRDKKYQKNPVFCGSYKDFFCEK